MPTSGPLSKLPVPESTLREWAQCLMNPKASLVERSRALWGLRHAGEKLAVSLLSDFLTETEPSPVADTLLQHEAAYCLGQRGDSEAVPVLIATMRNPKHHPVVRHEAAEALAALCGAPGVDMDQVQKELLEFADGKVPEVICLAQLFGFRYIVLGLSSINCPKSLNSLFPRAMKVYGVKFFVVLSHVHFRLLLL